MMVAQIDLPMIVVKEEAGGLSINTATFGLAGFDRLGILRADKAFSNK
jgi:hypothetical protein